MVASHPNHANHASQPAIHSRREISRPWRGMLTGSIRTAKTLREAPVCLRNPGAGVGCGEGIAGRARVQPRTLWRHNAALGQPSLLSARTLLRSHAPSTPPSKASPY